MDKNGWKRKGLLALAIVLIIVIAAIYLKANFVSGQSGLTPPLPPTKIPPGFRITSNATPTPDGPKQAQLQGTIYPTETRVVISKHTDLSPTLEDQDKLQVVVRHADGTNEQFSIGPLRSLSDLEQGLPPYIVSAIPLGPGDVITSWDTPSRYHRFAPGVLETLLAGPPGPPASSKIPTRPDRTVDPNSYPYPFSNPTSYPVSNP